MEETGQEQRVRWWERWYVAPMVTLAIAALVALVSYDFRPDLAKDAKISFSSSAKTCLQARDCGNAFFHTRVEVDPWVQYDFLAPRRLQRIEILNRTDCCAARAVPLLIEASHDGTTWYEVAQTERAFIQWHADFDITARYLRARVTRKSALHLWRISIR